MCFLENICGAFLQKQLQDVFIHDLIFFLPNKFGHILFTRSALTSGTAVNWCSFLFDADVI